jgi:type I restriction enzyme S subunit
MSSFIQKKWVDVCTLEYGKGIRDYKNEDNDYCVYGSAGRVGTHSEFHLDKGVIVSRKGTLDVHYSDTPFFVIDTAFFLKPKSELNPKWAYYALKNFDIKKLTSGSGVPSLSRDEFYAEDLFLPTLPEQKKIADLLDSFDSKIELNLKMNETLEEIAKTLFKSWFIDFDPVRAKAEGRPSGLSKEISELFPDSFEDSELGEIPKDWKVESIESLSSKIAMGPFGSDMKTSTYVEEGVPIISGKQMSGYLLKDEDNNFISPSHAQKLKNSLVQRGDTVITQTGTVGQVSLIPQNSKYSQYIVSSRQHFCRPLEDNLQEYLFCFLTSGKGQHELLKNVVTTGVPSISRPVTNLKSIQLVRPKRGVLDNFSQIVKPILTNISLNISINRDLYNLRDTILPKLISGELKIPDAENLIQEAVI